MQNSPVTISILAGPDTSASSLYGMFDMIDWLGTGWEDFVTGERVESRADVRIVAAGPKPFRCAGEVSVKPHRYLKEAEDSDVVLVPSLAMGFSAAPKQQDERMLDWLVQQQSRGATIGAACTGTVVLAQAGLLSGWEATSHWAIGDLFRIHYPDVRLRLDRVLCVSGRDRMVVTAGGSTSWQELALYVATRFYGVERALEMAKFWLIPSREETQASFAVMCQRVSHEDAAVKKSQAWIADNYATQNPVGEMVEVSGLPPTTFARRFKRATGYRPIDYVQALRMEQAKKMLEAGTGTVEVIGKKVGYSDPASFRRLFRRKAGLTPGTYRRRFGHRRFELYDLTGAAPDTAGPGKK